MENHGIIDVFTLAEADRIHEDANGRLAHRYTVNKVDFLAIAIRSQDGENHFLSGPPGSFFP